MIRKNLNEWRDEMSKSESYIVTLKDNKPLLFEENIYHQLAVKHNTSTLSSQIDPEEETIAEWKTPKYPLNTLAEMLELNTWHRRAVQIVAGDAQGKDWKLTPKSNLPGEPDNAQKQIAEEYIRQLPINVHKLFYQLTYDLRSLGVRCVELVDQDDLPSALYPMDPRDLQLHRDGGIVKQTVGTKTRYFTVQGQNRDENNDWYEVDRYTGQRYPVGTLDETRRANQVIWLTEYSTHTRSYGLANIIPAIGAVYGDMGRQEYNNKFFENYGVPAFAVTVTGDFKDEKPTLKNGNPNPKFKKENTLRYHIEKGLERLAENPHSALVITVPSISEDSNVDVQITQLSTTEKEGSFIQYRKDNREEVAAAHGVPLDRFGVAITGTLGGNAIEELGDVYSDTTLPTIIADNEYIIQSQIERLGVTDWEFHLDDFRKKDEQKELDIGIQLYTHGALTLGQFIERFAVNYGGMLDENSPLYNLRLINNQLIDEYGNILGQDSVGGDFLDELESDLLQNAEDEYTRQESDVKVTVNGEEHEDYMGILQATSKVDTDGIEDTANKHATNSIEETIRRAFNRRRKTQK